MSLSPPKTFLSLGVFAQALAWAMAVVLPVLLAYGLMPRDVAPDLVSDRLSTGQPTARFLPSESRQELERLFRENDYLLSAVRQQKQEVPRLFVDGLPKDLIEEQNIQSKKNLFIQIILPLVLRVNEKILDDRRRVISLLSKMAEDVAIAKHEITWLSSLSESYGFSYNDPDKLLLRLDTIPVSLALAQSIQESGWGTSRFALNGNALFGQRTWSTGSKGMVPTARGEGQAFKVKSFPGLIDSIEAYVHNLNTNRSYKYFRARRKAMRSDRRPLSGYVLTGTLLAYSEEAESYIAAIQAVMKSNQLQDFDGAKLSPIQNRQDLSS